VGRARRGAGVRHRGPTRLVSPSGTVTGDWPAYLCTGAILIGIRGSGREERRATRTHEQVFQRPHPAIRSGRGTNGGNDFEPGEREESAGQGPLEETETRDAVEGGEGIRANVSPLPCPAY